MARFSPQDLIKSANPIGRAVGYAFYDSASQMSRVKRIGAWSGIFLQGWAIWAASVHAVPWDYLWPIGLARDLGIVGVYLLGYCVHNATLTSELLRKAELESDQAAA